MARECGRAVASSAITSRPLPSSRRISTTAKAGAFWRMRSSPSATEWALRTSKPRNCMARSRRWRNARSSSTSTRDRSAGSSSGLNERSSSSDTSITPCAQQYSEPRAAAQASTEAQLTDAALQACTQSLCATLDKRLCRCLLVNKRLARPADGGHGAGRGKLAVFERYGGPGALEQRLGDEE